jgi:5-methylcytosine-specific restriction enzyme subunit McrC
MKTITKPVLPITQYGVPTVVDFSLSEEDEAIVLKLKSEAKIDINYDVRKQLNIYSHHYIGSVELTNFILRVDPSFVNITNIGRLYDFAYDIKKVRLTEKIKFADEYNHPLEFLVDSFVEECKEIFKVGLFKSYQTRDESIPTLKGKLILKQQIINQSRFNLKFHCEYDEFTSNNLENSILLDCLNTCQRVTKNEKNKTDIRKMINQISLEVEIKNTSLEDFKKLRYTRLNHKYEPAHTIAKSILSKRGMLNWNTSSESSIYPFFMKTWELFEQFVTKLFDKYYPLSIGKQIDDVAWIKYDAFDKPVDSKNIKPDIIVYKKSGVRTDKVAFIADAKLKDDPNTENFYQVSSYLNKYGVKKGFLFMPQSYKMKNLIEVDGTWKSEGQDLEIKEILFDVDGILDAKWTGREDEIKQRLLEVIPPEEYI